MRARTLLTALVLLACRRHPPTAPTAPTAPAAPDHPLQAPVPPTPMIVRPDACTAVGNPVGVRLPPGFCLYPIATELLRPRQMVVGPAGEILVAESGPGWRPNRGRVSVLRPQPDHTWRRETLVQPLDRPHGIALHDGGLWIAEAGRIVRWPYPPTADSVPETVVAGLPADGRHPHKTLAFGPDGRLYFSVGSATDNCVPPRGQSGHGDRPPPSTAPDTEAPDPCPESTPVPPDHERAVVNRWDPRTRRVEVFAHGLRNTLGLAWHPGTGRLYGVENSRDAIQRADPALSDATLPHDELNELVADADYGWPYCYDANVRSPEYPSASGRCGSRTRVPTILLPPHAAPLSILFNQGTLFPVPWRARALVAYHGYRAAGHRLVAIPFGPDGQPSGPPEDLIAGWEERPGRPHGHLTGLAEGPDGTVYLSDDVGGTVYALAWGPSALATATATAPSLPPAVAAEDPAVVEARCADLARRTDPLAVMQRDVLDTRCVPCHGASAGGLTLARCDWRRTWEALVHGRSAAYGPYVIPGRTDQGVLMARLQGESMGPRMPQQGVALAPEELSAVQRWIAAGAPSP